MSPVDPPAVPTPRGRVATFLVASLLLIAGVALLLTGHWWARPVIGLLDGIPGGKWLSVPVPYLPIIAVAFGARLLAAIVAQRARIPR